MWRVIDVISAKADLVENWNSQILFVSHDVFLTPSLKIPIVYRQELEENV